MSDDETDWGEVSVGCFALVVAGLVVAALAGACIVIWKHALA